LFCSIGFNYILALRIERATFLRRAWLILALAVNLGALIYFKYLNFAIASLQHLSRTPIHYKYITLPLGISFFTFTQIAYLVDVYKTKGATDHNPISYFLFVTFFPHLIAGPILHHKEMMPQFVGQRKSATAENIAAGLSMFAIGLFKKVLLADSLASIASPMFAAVQRNGSIAFLPAWMAALAYTVQIYFDFSGYSDMAVGIGRMFGIELPINFNSPYKATSIIDFWRRWHITLSRFLRDYVYIPLGGNRKGEARRFLNLFLTMVIGGIWHGAGWTFLLWGLLHGIYLVINHYALVLGKRGRWAVPSFLGKALTMLCVVVAWVPFRASGLKATLSIWKGMSGFNGIGIPDFIGRNAMAFLHLRLQDTSGLSRIDMMLVACALVACWFFPNSQQILSNFRIGLVSAGYQAAPPAAPWLTLRSGWTYVVFVGAVLGLALRGIGGYSEFIYYHF
jgi:D-alanyl-lipoteichoic acid acyltransferase DltB (MBOAT superfamily)